MLFVKVKERVLQNEWSFAVQAKKYTQWMEAQAGPGQTGWGTAAGLAQAALQCSCPPPSPPLGRQAAGHPEVLANVYKTEPRRINFPRMAYMLQRGPECFDWRYYLEHNEDLRQLGSKEALWAHFLRGGAYEGRHFRFTCEPQY